jgi:putative ABC transport system permease protein
VPENQQALKQEDTVLFDELSRSEFGPIASQFKAGKTVFSEVSAHKVKVAGLFKLGTSFGADGNIITSDLTYAKIFPSLDPTLISIGVIKLKPGANPNQVIASIREKLNMGDVKIFSRQEFIDYEIFYWQSSTAIGFIFTLGTVMGFIVGIVIVYQILYTDIANHLPEYATLKAMGYSNLYLLNIVFQEALILACLGYLPGLGLTLLLYSNTAVATGLPIMMTLARALSVLVLTIVMCCLSGSIAANRLRSADPADIF